MRAPRPLPDDEDLDAIRRALEPECRARAAVKRAKLREAAIDAHAVDETMTIEELRDELARIDAGVEAYIADRLRRATLQTWATIARDVYRRDGGRCHVCGRAIEPEDYECGHIVDRCRDGTDRPSNLVAMHVVCNRLKPPHASREEYLAWVASLPI